MKPILLFRCHAYPSICENRVGLLKKNNPGLEMYGLFGGQEKDYPRFHKVLSPFLSDIYCLRNKPPEWKWKNGDLALRLWYQEVGKDIAFDLLYWVEWDLLLLDAVAYLYRDLPPDALGLTALTPMGEVEKEWLWTSHAPYQKEWMTLFNLVRKKFDLDQQPLAMQGPGPCLPRDFLAAYCALEVPELCNDEVRIPLFAQALGFKLYDTGFKNECFGKGRPRVFHCYLYPEISLKTIKKELKDPWGARVFHPFRRTLVLDGRRDMVTATVESLRAWKKRLSHSMRELFK